MLYAYVVNKTNLKTEKMESVAVYRTFEKALIFAKSRQQGTTRTWKYVVEKRKVKNDFNFPAYA